MSGEVGLPKTPMVPKLVTTLRDEAPMVSQASSSNPFPQNNGAPPSSRMPAVGARDSILSVASKTAAQTLQNLDPEVWGVLTAISSQARKRPQGINMLLKADKHCIGRLVHEDTHFVIDSSAVSARHCMIYRKQIASENVEHSSNHHASVFLKDTSTNGTFLNWEKLHKSSAEVKIQHGDIISFVNHPHSVNAFAFVYREVTKSGSSATATNLKRKAVDYRSESKRLKGIGIRAPEGPISLDDFRSLQRSNTELRKQLECQVRIADMLRNENRVAVERKENEMKELQQLTAKSYLDQLAKLRSLLDTKQNELFDANRIFSEKKHVVRDLNERLSASIQSCTEANEIIYSQKASISELKAQLDEERDQRRAEREKATADMKAAIQKVQSEAQEEFRRISDASFSREREQHEVISKLQELDKERCLLVETLRSKLEDTRHKLLTSENKIHQLEAQVHEEQQASASGKKREDEFENEVKRLRKELDSEKAAREEAWAQVSVLELQINAALRDLDFERRKLRGARERIMLRETQLRAFYSTTEEISVLFTKQQEQLKAMQRTLEDQENYENTSLDIDFNPHDGKETGVVREIEAAMCQSNSTAKAGSASSGLRLVRNLFGTSSNDTSATEKHECVVRSREEAQDTQEVEFTSTDRGALGGFGSDIAGAATGPPLDGNPIGTEHVITESPGTNGVQNLDLNAICDGDTLQLDDETHVQETEEQGQMMREGSRHSQADNSLEIRKGMEDTEGGESVRTADLLASEVAGSWAHNTEPSVHEENETPGNGAEAADRQPNSPSAIAAATLLNLEPQAPSRMIEIVAPDLKEEFQSGAQAAHGQPISPSSESAAAAALLNLERQALSRMIGTVAPDLKKPQFQSGVGNKGLLLHPMTLMIGTASSDSDAEDLTDTANGYAKGAGDDGRSASDAETEDCGHAEENAMDEDSDATDDDSDTVAASPEPEDNSAAASVGRKDASATTVGSLQHGQRPRPEDEDKEEDEMPSQPQVQRVSKEPIYLKDYIRSGRHRK